MAWVWSISYAFASLVLSLGVWAYLSDFYAQAHPATVYDRFSLESPLPASFSSLESGPLLVPREQIVREIVAMSGRALLLVFILAVPGFQANQLVWAALRARPRRIRRARVYGWKLLALNAAILLAGPLLASAQYYLDRKPFFGS